MTKEEKHDIASVLLSDDTLIDIFSIEDTIERESRIAECTLKAAECGIKADFKRMVKVYDEERKRAEKQRRASENGNRITEFPEIVLGGRKYDQMQCGTWIADMDGIRQVVGYNTVIACSHPILPVRTLHNTEFSTYKTEIAYYKRGRWMSTIVEKSDIASRSAIVKLANMDVGVTSENAGALVRYLSDVENMNKIEIMSSASRLGWHGDDFVPYCDDIVFDNEAAFSATYSAIKQHGDVNRWLEIVRRVRASGRCEPRFFMAATFSSVIVSWCNALPFIANLYGDTEGGKTVTTKLCTSIFACPDDGKYWMSFMSTEAGTETRLNFLNNMPMILDDHAKVPLYFDVSAFAYSVCNGTGKNRSNKDLGNRPMMTWCNVTITNGEQPLSDNDTKAGAANRILDFEADHSAIYGSKEFAVELCTTITENYGFAGRMFVDACKKIGRDTVIEIQKRHLDEIGKLEGKMDKQSISLSIVMAADEIAERYIFKDGVRLKLDEVSKVLVDQKAISENQRCYEYLMDEIVVHQNFFVPDRIGDEYFYKSERWGCKDDDYVYIIPKIFSKIVSDGGGKRKSFLSWLKREGKLKHNDGRLDLVKKFPDGFRAKTFAVNIVHYDADCDDIEDCFCEI